MRRKAAPGAWVSSCRALGCLARKDSGTVDQDSAIELPTAELARTHSDSAWPFTRRYNLASQSAAVALRLREMKENPRNERQR